MRPKVTRTVRFPRLYAQLRLQQQKGSPSTLGYPVLLASLDRPLVKTTALALLVLLLLTACGVVV
jgi:hypothetical protein